MARQTKRDSLLKRRRALVFYREQLRTDLEREITSANMGRPHDDDLIQTLEDRLIETDDLINDLDLQLTVCEAGIEDCLDWLV